MPGRHFRRLIERYEDEGREGLRDRRLGKPSRRATTSELMRMRRLYQECYGDFSAKHFHEQLQERHGYKLGYTVTRRPNPSVQRIGLEAARKRRPRASANHLLWPIKKTARAVAAARDGGRF